MVLDHLECMNICPPASFVPGTPSLQFLKGAEGQFLKEGLSWLLFNVVCINHQSPGFWHHGIISLTWDSFHLFFVLPSIMTCSLSYQMALCSFDACIIYQLKFCRLCLFISQTSYYINVMFFSWMFCLMLVNSQLESYTVHIDWVTLEVWSYRFSLIVNVFLNIG